MNLEIQLISKPEMSVQEAAQNIAANFPYYDDRTVPMSYHPARGTVLLLLDEQKQLTDDQRDWLHITPFAARYIDSYHVVDERWTLQAAGDFAEKMHAVEDATNVQDSLWFLAVVNARAGEQVQRAVTALGRIAAVLEERQSMNLEKE